MFLGCEGFREGKGDERGRSRALSVCKEKVETEASGLGARGAVGARGVVS